MKITISNYEGTSDFRAFTAELPNDVKLDDFIEALTRIFYSEDILLDVKVRKK